MGVVGVELVVSGEMRSVKNPEQNQQWEEKR